MITIQSFSYRAPPPEVADGFVFDCRMLANPGREERFRNLTGLDSSVRNFFKQHTDEIEGFLRPIKSLVGFAIKEYGRKGHANLTVSFGCMGGQHRSVYCAERLAEWVRSSMHTQVATRHFVIASKFPELLHRANERRIRMNVVDRVARLAMIAHNGVNRTGPGNVPYVVHPHAVVSMLKEWGYTEKEDAITLSVAWGHDILEDTDTPESAIRGIDGVLGERILIGIKMLTFKPGVPSGHSDYGRLKANYIANVARTAPPEIIVVKIADRLCNTLDFMNDGDAEHAYAYLGYGEPLFLRIGDCKHSEAILEARRSVKEIVCKFRQEENNCGHERKVP